LVRVCFIASNGASAFFPDLPPRHGGTETQTFQNSTRLAAEPEFDVHAIVHGDGPARTAGGVTVHFTPIVPGVGAKLTLQRLMRRVDAHVYIQQGIGSVTKEVAFFCLWRRRAFVYWAASDYDIDRSVGRTDVDRTPWFDWGLRNADLCVAQSRHQQSLYMDRYGRDSVLIRNAFPAREPSREDRKFVLWVGRFVPVKRPELFVKLAKELPDERFVMIAPPSPSEPHPRFEQLLGEIESRPNLDLIPGVPAVEIDRYFDRAKMLVNTSTTEGFPNTFVQAMWAGTPLASLDFDPDGMIAAHRLGVAPPGELGEFAEQIGELALSAGRLAECGARAHDYAARHHDLDRNVGRLARKLKTFQVS
jgi:glycosyltransferase involved in cell wall biosynthesis